MVTLFVAAISLAAGIAFATGWLWTGLVLALVSGPLDGVDGKLARSRLEFSRWGDLEHLLDKIAEYGWYLALAGHFAVTRGEGPWALAALIVVVALAETLSGEFYRRFTGTQLDDAGPPERRFRLIGGRRNTYFWTLLPFAAAGAWYAGFIMIAVYATLTFFVMQWRLFVRLGEFGRRHSPAVAANYAATAYRVLCRATAASLGVVAYVRASVPYSGPPERMMMPQINVAIAGVGNCASSLVQGIGHYANGGSNDEQGLMHWDLGGYRPKDVRIVAAWDIGRAQGRLRRRRRDFRQAEQYHGVLRPCRADRHRGADGPAPRRRCRAHGRFSGGADVRPRRPAEPDLKDVVAVLRESRTDVLMIYLPVGSQAATEFYAEAALQAGCAFVNNIPVFIASDPVWAERFRVAGVRCSVTTSRRSCVPPSSTAPLTDLFAKRGVTIDRTYQLNTGGNTDFLNMLERSGWHRRRFRRRKPFSRSPHTGSTTRISMSVRRTMSPGRTTTRSASCAWKAGCSAVCR